MTRKEARNKLIEDYCFVPGKCKGIAECKGTCADCEICISAQALEQEPKMGHWVKHNTSNNTYYYDCSLCGCVAPCTETADGCLWKLSNFCPNCGAKMVEQKSEDKE